MIDRRSTTHFSRVLLGPLSYFGLLVFYWDIGCSTLWAGTKLGLNERLCSIPPFKSNKSCLGCSALPQMNMTLLDRRGLAWIREEKKLTKFSENCTNVSNTQHYERNYLQFCTLCISNCFLHITLILTFFFFTLWRIYRIEYTITNRIYHA